MSIYTVFYYFLSFDYEYIVCELIWSIGIEILIAQKHSQHTH